MSFFVKLLLLSSFYISSASLALAATTARVDEFILIHAEATILKHPSYAALNKLTDPQLLVTVLNPKGGDYVTVKKGTLRLMDGNTRIYLLKKRGYGATKIPYDTYDSSSFDYDF